MQCGGIREIRKTRALFISESQSPPSCPTGQFKLMVISTAACSLSPAVPAPPDPAPSEAPAPEVVRGRPGRSLQRPTASHSAAAGRSRGGNVETAGKKAKVGVRGLIDMYAQLE